MIEPRRPREVKNWVVCEETGQHAINGACPTHHGDACLIAVGWVDNSHVRRELAEVQARLWALEAVARRVDAAHRHFRSSLPFQPREAVWDVFSEKLAGPLDELRAELEPTTTKEDHHAAGSD